MSNENLLPDLRGRTILQLIPRLDLGGAEQTVLDISSAIISAGGKALVVSEGGRLEGQLEHTGAELIKAPIASRNPFIMRHTASWLRKLSRDRSIDILHARSRAPAWVAWWSLGGTMRTDCPKFVTTYHGAYSARSSLKHRYNAIMARGDRVIANSSWTAQEIRRQYGLTEPRLTTIARGTDIERYSPANVSARDVSSIRRSWLGETGSDRWVLLLPGRFRTWKGQRVAIEALAGLPESIRSKTRLVLAGRTEKDESYSQTLRQLAHRFGLSDKVLLVAPPENFPAALAAADIVLSPSLRPEAFGRIAVEAGLMERPVIAADHGGALETVRHDQTGIRVKPGDADALTDAIGTMLAAPDAKRQAMGRAARSHCQQHFALDALKAKTLSVYSNLLKNQECNG